MNASPKKLLFAGGTAAAAILVGYIAFASYITSEDSDAAVPDEKVTSSSYRLPKPDENVSYSFPKEQPKQEQLPYDNPKEKVQQQYRAPASNYSSPPQKQQPKKLNINFGQDDSGGQAGGADYSRIRLPSAAMQDQGISHREQQPLQATRQNLVNENREFLANARQHGGFGVVRGQVQPAVSDMMLQTGLIITMEAMNAASTRQPGMLVAEVKYDVYDSLTQSCVLVPAGTRVVGPVNSQVAYAADNMQAPFTRLHFPNGSVMDIEGMPATGVDGKPGIDGRVDRHVFNMALAVLGSALFTTLGQAGAIFSDGEQTVVNVGTQAMGTSASNVGSEIVQRQLDVQNEIYIEQKDEVALMVTNDIPLPAYEGRCQ